MSVIMNKLISLICSIVFLQLESRRVVPAFLLPVLLPVECSMDAASSVRLTAVSPMRGDTKLYAP